MFGCNLDKEEFPPENYQALKTIISIYLARCVEILFISANLFVFYLPYLHGVTFLHDVYVIFSKSQVRRIPSIITCSKPSRCTLVVESQFSFVEKYESAALTSFFFFSQRPFIVLT